MPLQHRATNSTNSQKTLITSKTQLNLLTVNQLNLLSELPCHLKVIPLDVMMDSAPISNESSYSEFIADFQCNLEAAYGDVRQRLKVAQCRHKDAYDKEVRHMVFQAGDLVLCYHLQVRPGEVNKFHHQWEGPYKIVE